MTSRANFIWLILVSNIGSAFAVDLSTTPNAREISRLPVYCQDKLSGFVGSKPSAEAHLWPGRIGKNWLDFHHYCYALNFVNRYWAARTAKERTYYLERAMANFDYMVRAEKPDFSLRAELYSNRGDVFKLQNKLAEAARDYRHAIELNPKLTRPYLQLIDLYEGRKQRAEALEIATAGLRHIPDSKAMQRRYIELGGKKPFPEPIAVKANEPEPNRGVEPIATPETVTEQSPTTVIGPEAESTTTKTTSTPEAPEAIGTSKNPYCRFCPPE